MQLGANKFAVENMMGPVIKSFKETVGRFLAQAPALIAQSVNESQVTSTLTAYLTPPMQT